MEKCKRVLVFFIIFLIVISCKTMVNKPSNNVDKNSNSIFDEQWRKTLIDSKTELLNAWLKVAPFNIESWVAIRSDLLVSETEKASLNCIPVETFVIDSISFRKLTKDTRLESIMKLKKDETTCYLLKNNTFLVNGQFTFRNNIWSNKNMGLNDKVRAEALADIYFNKNLPIFEVLVQQSSHYSMPYTAYLENGVMWMLLRNGGKITLKDFIISDQHFDDEEIR